MLVIVQLRCSRVVQRCVAGQIERLLLQFGRCVLSALVVDQNIAHASQTKRLKTSTG